MFTADVHPNRATRDSFFAFHFSPFTFHLGTQVETSGPMCGPKWTQVWTQVDPSVDPSGLKWT